MEDTITEVNIKNKTNKRAFFSKWENHPKKSTEKPSEEKFNTSKSINKIN